MCVYGGNKNNFCYANIWGGHGCIAAAHAQTQKIQKKTDANVKCIYKKKIEKI